ncbi:MAG: hypothetical protein HOW73_00830 [Polyangiaceae bacterium]|nr:hypothetical protein [Polyangiaceae bacterium]
METRAVRLQYVDMPANLLSMPRDEEVADLRARCARLTLERDALQDLLVRMTRERGDPAEEDDD